MRRISFALIGALCLWAQISAQAASAPNRSVITLRGLNVLAAEGSRYIDVVLERPAATSAAKWSRRSPSKDIQVEGSGTFAGFALIGDKSFESPTYLVAGQWNPGGDIRNVLYGSDDQEDGEYNLAPGRYRLHILGEGPVRVTLRLDGLSGSGRIQAVDESSVDMKQLPTGETLEAAGNYVHWMGDDFTGEGDGLGLTLWRFRAKDYKELEIHECVYVEEPPPPELAYGPGCQYLNRRGPGSRWTIGEPEEGGWSSFSVASLWGLSKSTNPVPAKEDRGYGVWFRAGGKVKTFQAAALFLSY